MLSSGSKIGGREATGAVVAGRFALSIGRTSLPEPSGYEWRALSDLARLESGHTPSRGHPEYWEGGIPWVGIRDATAHHGNVINDTNQHVSELGLLNSSARLLPAGTVCLSRTASVGYVVIMGVPMATSQDFVNWVCGPELSSSYLRYILMAEQESVRRFSYGTTHKTMYYPDAKALQVLVPTRSKQDATAEVLGALDDKITANKKLSATAALLANALFAEAIAQGSEEHRLSEITSMLTRGIAPKYSDSEDTIVVLNQKCIRDQRVNLLAARRTLTSKVREDRVLAPNDLLINSTGQGTLGRTARWTRVERATADSHISIVRFDPMKMDQVCAGYGLLRLQPVIEDMGEGSTGQTELSRSELGKLRLVLPARPTQVALGIRLSALSATEESYLAQNETLAAARDALLPQLISGKLRVRDAEKVLEGVL
jgi:type I restriction enzyme S subunit